ncbi:uncharacterized protein LOC131154534 isoform X2 [Malania oleifera]|uniref:uncharacterized protein LOC131154534 isoform X2 n=1 Tax=Malania oleifera TaxID=397392 RepID=UPI0025AEA8C5|nr:uncharacterized protein LOC131154534 isoform X2 [Malania oleifera]
MEVDKRGSKGGFLHLLDWHGKSKSRKKLPDKSERPDLHADRSMAGRENVDNLIEVDENAADLSCRQRGDCSHPSIVSADEGCGTKAPGLVARLMGLDSLPSSGVSECHPDSLLDSCSISDPYHSKTTPNLMSEHQSMANDGMPDDFNGFNDNPVKSSSPKAQTRPIERFRTEITAPKSDKSVPTTRHKLFSPIKYPGFSPNKNTAYVMESAAKFIEAASRESIKGKIPSSGLSSVPLRIRNLKEEVEAAQKVSRPAKQKEPGTARNVKEQSQNKRWSGLQGRPIFKALTDSEKITSETSKNKEKSISLALQAKFNVQKREGLTSSSNGKFKNQKEQAEIDSNHIFRSDPGMQRSAQKRTSSNKTSTVLKQNNQKQNCVSTKDTLNNQKQNCVSAKGTLNNLKQNSVSTRDRLTTKSSGSCQQARKAMSMNGSSGPSKTINTVVVSSESGSRKMGSVRTGIEKYFSSSKTNNFSCKKRSVNEDIHFDESVCDNVFSTQDDRFLQCNGAIDGSMNQGVKSRKSIDVVSFTFMSPIKRSTPTPQSSEQVMEKSDCFYADSCGDCDLFDLKEPKLLAPALDEVGGDALSVLLEQKLMELTFRVESSPNKQVQPGTTTSTASSLQESVSTVSVVSPTAMEEEKRFQFHLQENESDNSSDFDCPSIHGSLVNANQEQEDLKGVEEHCTSSSSGKTGVELDYKHPIPVPILEPSSSRRSCNSSDSRSTDSNCGTGYSLLTESPETISRLPRRKSQPMDGDTELSDSALSMSSWDVSRWHTIIISDEMDDNTTNWERRYVRNIICFSELLYKESALGQAQEVLKPSVFDQLENQKTRSGRSRVGSRLDRKLLFDCVSECLDLRCRWLSGGGCKACAKWVNLFQSKGWLAEELCNEILGWRSMAELWVDELVDKDMSCKNGRWLDFEIEAFEHGMEIEKDIFTCLVDELVDDLFLS